MQRKRPHPASMDEVRIGRDGEDAVIDYADEAIGTMHLHIGAGIAGMSDQDILELHNEVVTAIETLADAHEDVVVEIPPGREQIAYSARCDQWVPRADVLRCLIEDDAQGRPVVRIDDRVLSLEEFGRLLVTHAGWGMRIAFVPDDRTHVVPHVEVREPDTEDQ